MFLIDLEIEANKESVFEEMDLTIYLDMKACSVLSQLPYWCSIVTED